MVLTDMIPRLAQSGYLFESTVAEGAWRATWIARLDIAIHRSCLRIEWIQS